MIRRSLPLLLAFAAALPPTPVAAACTQCSCAIDTTGLAFGPYNPRRPSTGSAGTIRITCEGDNGYTLNMSSGSSGTPLTRTLHSGAAALNYNLFKDPPRTMIWGDGSAGQSGLTGAGTATYNIYGTIFGGQAPQVGIYTDTLVISVEY